jgi:hypothetical protein
MADRPKVSFERAVSDRAVATPGVFAKQLFRFSHQIVAQTPNLFVIGIDHRLEVAFQMSPAPLQNAVLKVHPRSIAVDAAGEFDSDRRRQHDRLASRSEHEHVLQFLKIPTLNSCWLQATAVGDPGTMVNLIRECAGRRTSSESRSRTEDGFDVAFNKS